MIATSTIGMRLAGRPAMEPQALEDLFRGSAADVHAYAISLLGDRASAEEVTALAFERLLRSRRPVDARRGSARALLFAIARNAAIDELRRRGRRPRPAPVGEPPTALVDRAAGEAFAGVERRAGLAPALRALPLREREVILLKFHGQLSNAELGRALGISESNAGSRLHRALERLRHELADRPREEVA